MSLVKIDIKQAVPKRMKLKDLVVGQPFVLSETNAQMVLVKAQLRQLPESQSMIDAQPKNTRLVLSLNCGYVDLMDEDREVLPVDAELTGQVMTL